MLRHDNRDEEDVSGSDCCCCSSDATFLLTLLNCSSCLWKVSRLSSSHLLLSSTLASAWPRLLSALQEKVPRMPGSQEASWSTWRLSRLQVVTPGPGWSRRSPWRHWTTGVELEWTTHCSSRPHRGWKERWGPSILPGDILQQHPGLAQAPGQQSGSPPPPDLWHRDPGAHTAEGEVGPLLDCQVLPHLADLDH